MTETLAAVIVTDYADLATDCVAQFGFADGRLPIRFMGAPTFAPDGAAFMLIVAMDDAERVALFGLKDMINAVWPGRVTILADVVGQADWTSRQSTWSTALSALQSLIEADPLAISAYRSIVPAEVAGIDPITDDPIMMPRGSFWSVVI